MIKRKTEARRVLITGGAGFDPHVADHLIGAGYDVRVLDILDEQVHGPAARSPLLPPRGPRFGGRRRPRQLIGDLEGRRIEHRFAECRTGDQRYYASCFDRFNAATGWRPRFDVEGAVTGLRTWLGRHRAKTSGPAMRAASAIA